jgi:hypothetical protein
VDSCRNRPTRKLNLLQAFEAYSHILIFCEGWIEPMLRTVIFTIVGLATAVWLSFVVTVSIAPSDLVGRGWAIAFVAIPSAAFLVFALPAFILALKRKLLGLALTLALLSVISVVLVA